MDKELREQVLGMVAGMRGEKRAESAAREEAYVAGFCKAAEIAGVSPRSVARRYAMSKAAQAAQAAQPGQPGQQQDVPRQVAENFPARGGTRAIGNYYLENVGQAATPGAGAAIGAALGSQRANRLLSRIKMRGFRSKGIGALAGLSVGVMTNMLGKVKSIATEGRTAQDQIDHDVALNFSNLLPGVGAYNAGKRQERVQLSRWYG